VAETPHPTTTTTGTVETPVPTAPRALAEQASGLLSRALEMGASDVHLDFWGESARFRYRVDGRIHATEEVNHAQARRLINQFKVAADLDVEATVEPLEGQFRWADDSGAARDVRVTIVPTSPAYEGLHLRLLTSPEEWHTIANLGLSGDDLKTIDRQLENPQGLVLVSGATGSGKTTTLYALARLEHLRQLVTVSIEDPAEFDLPWARQVEVDHDRGLTMESGLRTLLRMDPDVILVGEIRDAQSANIAARAAMTGRLVIATIHGRDGAGAVDMLHYLNVPYYVIGNALRVVIAQNLVPVLCRECAKKRRVEDYEKEWFEKAEMRVPSHLWEPGGCAKCGDRGFNGRTGVFGVVPIDRETGAWICQGRHQHELRERFACGATRPIFADGLDKAANGVTTMRHVLRLIE